MFFFRSSLFLFLISYSFARSIGRLSDDIEVEGQSSNNEAGNIWVVLVAGSRGYENYRHQADVLHAYQLVQKKHKIPKERIVLMMYDDIAYNLNNPYSGNIINSPGGENLYTDNVTPQNFLGVLLKDKKLIEQNKKVLNSTSEDSVFIYFSGHGAESLVCFPHEILHATALKAAFNKMKDAESFKKMVIYLEACQSGSMFDGAMKPPENVYVLTACKPNESSSAAFCDDKVRKTCLSDLFSINWLLDSYELDNENETETLFTQFLHVKDKTNLSTVCEYGDTQMSRTEYAYEFQGEKSASQTINSIPTWTEEQMGLMRSDEVEYHFTKMRSNFKQDDSFEKLVRGRKMIDEFMESLRAKFSSKLSVSVRSLQAKSKNQNRNCYEDLVTHLHKHCLPIHVHTYLARHLKLFVNSCNAIKRQDTSVEVADLIAIVTEHCASLRSSELIQITKIV